MEYKKPYNIYFQWALSQWEHFVFFITHPFLILRKNIDRIGALILLILLVLLNLQIDYFYFILGIDVDDEHKIHMIESNVHHLQTILFIYVLFGDKIIKFLKSSTYMEVERFYLNDFYLDVSKSYKHIRIMETFLQLILTDSKMFYGHCMEFAKRCEKHRYAGKIQILLLDPMSEYAESRIMELKPTYANHPEFMNLTTDSEFVSRFQYKMIKWLRELNDIQLTLSTYTESLSPKVTFETRIYNCLPPYSLYSCDDVAYFGYYREDTQTTHSKQGIIRNLGYGFTRFQLERFKEIWNNGKNKSRTIPLGEYLDNYMPRNSDLVEKFKSLFISTNETEIKKLLLELNPSSLRSDELFSIIAYLEHGKLKQAPQPHYNIFGTGGDINGHKTINITTIASILATHIPDEHIHIKKAGTVAVTSLVGSQQFYDSLLSKTKNRKRFIDKYPNLNISLFDFANSSGFVYLHEQYRYKNIVKEVREQLFDEHILDIFKVVFPVSNFTGCSAQINGLSDTRYLAIYEKIFEKFSKTGILLHNTSHTDELMVGENTIHVFVEGRKLYVADIPIKISMKEEDYWKEFQESTADEHCDKFFKLFDPSTPDDIKWTIAYNIGLILKLNYLEDETIIIQDLASKAYDVFFKPSP